MMITRTLIRSAGLLAVCMATPMAVLAGNSAAPIPEPNIVTLLALGGVIGMLLYRSRK